MGKWLNHVGSVDAGACNQRAGNVDQQMSEPRSRPRHLRPRQNLLTASFLSVLPLLSIIPLPANAQDLEGFAILSGQSITNTGPTTIIGDIGISPGSTYTGSGSVTQTGTTYLGEAVALRIQNDLTTLYNVLEGRPTSINGNLTGRDLGGLTLGQGVYNFDTSAGLATGQTLVLDGNGDPNAVFIFNIGSTLTVGSGAAVQLVNGAQGGNVFYRVGSSATVDTSAVLEGQIVALTSISLLTSARISCGAALARNGSVTLDTNTIRVCDLTGVSFVDAVNGIVPDDDDETPPPDDGTPPDEDVTGPPSNVVATAAALDNFTANGGVLPVSFSILAAALTPAELAEALAQLSGEVASGIAPSAFRTTDSFLDRVLGARSGPEDLGRRAPVAPPAAVPATISVLGYWPLPSAALDRPVAPLLDNVLAQPSWDIWLGANGDYSRTDGDAMSGSHERTANQYGVALGAAYFVTPYTTLGWAIGTGRSNFELGDSFGAGGSDDLQAAFYARTRYDAAYLTGAVAYGYHDMWTDRTITIGGNDRLTADFTAHTVAAHVEAGYKIGWITPYAGLRGRMLMTPDYSERAEYGASTFAMDYESRTATSLRTELGAQVQWSTPLSDSAVLDLRLRGAWLHEFDPVNDVDASFQFLGAGSTFTVSGARADRNSVSLATGAELRRTDGFYVAAAVDAQLSSNAQAYGGAVKVGVRW